VRLRLQDYCTSPERLAWAKANGCHWGVPNRMGWNNPCAVAARGGHLAALRWARAHGKAVQVDTIKTRVESASGFSARSYNVVNSFQTQLLAALRWARAHGKAVQVDTIKTRVESASGFSARSYNVVNSFQTQLSRHYSTGANGVSGPVHTPLRAGTWRC